MWLHMYIHIYDTATIITEALTGIHTTKTKVTSHYTHSYIDKIMTVHVES